MTAASGRDREPNIVKAIKKALKEIGDILNRVLEALLGQNQPQPELIPIPVRNNSRRNRHH